MKLKNNLGKLSALFAMFFILQISSSFAIDIQILGGFYNESLYEGYPAKGTYKVELSKDNYTFNSDQFEINISLPSQGAYDPSRAAEVVVPQGWELVLNSNTSMILRLLPGTTYAGSGAAANRRKDFYIPIITSAPASDNPSLVTLEWKDFFTDELAGGNTGGSVLNVANALPVNLKSFKAVRENNTALLNWITTEETNSDKFDIQRNTKATGWVTIGSKKSHAESRIERAYDFTDSSPLDGENLYRLKMVDLDGTFAYSSVKSVKFELPGEDLSVYPNPSADYIKLRDATNVRAVSITDIKGIMVYQTGSVSKDEISVKNLTPGMYSVRIERKNGLSSVQKLVVAR